jgi:glycosyltransferase involved in cell wall biosynthesis
VKVSIVVPAYNEAALLPLTLNSIVGAMGVFERRGWGTELIVCDNNSTDATSAIAAEAGALVVFEPINQISRARNAGAACASGDWLLFIDADSHPTPALFEDVARAIEEGRCLAGGSTVRFDTERWNARFGAAMWNITSRVARWAAGSFIFCDAAAFRAAGGFSEELFAAEELDLFRRLKRLARRTSRSIVILHEHPLLTSSRKLHLYHWRETLPFFLKTVATGGRTLRSASGAFVWYDGRR